GSGAFGVVTVNGKQVMYLPLTSLSPAGNGQIAVVDVGIVPAPGHNVDDAGTPALVTNIDLGTFDQATATAGDSSVVVAAGTATHKVWFIDPSTNKVVHTTELDPNLTGGSFSGGGGIVDGIAIDEANHRAILSVWNGFQFIDLGDCQVTGYVLAAGAENFGYDSTKQYLLSPFYDCQPGIEFVDAGTPATQAPPCDSYLTPGDAGLVISDGFNLIDISKSSAVVYTYESSAPDSGIASDPVGFSPDSAAVDTTTGIAMISSEGSSFYTFLDLSKAVFSKGPPATFTAPSTVLVPSAGADDGVSIEPVSHIAFTEQEFSNQ